jgi:2-polyprenyl-3-methyl-5-hydroxy-6-metoxy-1,4-benzoquinol methylase
MVFSDLTADEYAHVRHNVWDEAEPGPAALTFYGAARERAHDEFLQRNPRRGSGRLLDVGCGLGFFLERAAGRGWEVAGLDTSPNWVELANRRLGSDRVRLSAVEEADFPRASFAQITVWDVLEHVYDPVPFLSRLRELLEPGGRLFIRTPNFSYVYPVYATRRLMKSNVELGPTNHVVYFTSRTIRAALDQAGLTGTAWPVLPPPQVAFAPRPSTRPDVRTRAILAAKNAYAGTADAIARITAGRVVVGSDLDVMCISRGDGSG